MNKKLLIGIIVVLVIAAAFFPLALIGVWIYLVWMVWKKKISLFHDQMEPKSAERRYKMLKAFLWVAGYHSRWFGLVSLWVLVYSICPQNRWIILSVTSRFLFLGYLIWQLLAAGLYFYKRLNKKAPVFNSDAYKISLFKPIFNPIEQTSGCMFIHNKIK